MSLLSQLASILIQVGYRALIFAVILGAGWVVGRLVGLLVRSSLSRLGADSILRKSSIGRAIIKSGYTASQFFDNVSRWIIYLAATLFALDSLGIPTISQSVSSFIDFLPDLVAGLLVLVVGFVLSDWFGEFIKRSIPQEQKDTFYLGTVAEILKVVLYFITITLALRQIGIDTTVLYIFAEAIAWGIAIAVGVAAGIVAGWFLKDRVKEWLA